MDPNRRDFIRAAGAGAAALAGLRGVAGAGGAPKGVGLPEVVRSRTGGGSDDTAYWELVRAQFTIPGDRLFLNPATLGPQPRSVVDAVVEHTRRTAETYPPATDWDALKLEVGGLLNAEPAGLVFPRNTTEGMNFVAQGLELSAGDEVLTTDHEHIGGLCCWQLLQARRGVSLRQLPLPVPAASADEIVDLFRGAITPRTRVISVSHVTFTNGTLMPVREIVDLCRERGIVSVTPWSSSAGWPAPATSGAAS